MLEGGGPGSADAGLAGMISDAARMANAATAAEVRRRRGDSRMLMVVPFGAA